MENNNQQYIQKQDPKDISIKELLLKIWKGKWIIAAITVICLILGLVFTWFVLEEIYVSKVIIQTYPIKQLDYTTKTYATQLKDETVLNMTAEDLESKDISISAGSLNQLISVVADKDTGLIEITARNTNPQTAMLTANSLSDSFVEFSSKDIEENFELSEQKIRSQLKIEKEKLENQSILMKDYLIENESTKELNMEIEGLMNQKNNFNFKLREAETRIRKNELFLTELYNFAENFDLDILNKIDVDSLLHGEAAIYNKADIQELRGGLLIIKIAETEADLLEARSNKESLIKTMEDIKNQLESKQLLLIDSRHVYNEIPSEYNFALSSYELVLEELTSLLNAVAHYTSKDGVTIVSEAVLAATPIEPDKVKNLVVALIIGLILGAAVVLLRSYFMNGTHKSSKKLKNRQNKGNL